jgi:holdfast attachment protein HfaA
MRASDALLGLMVCAAAASSCPAVAQAGDFANSATYNTPIDTVPGSENQPINPSLRDQNGNLTVVNGQFTSSASAHAFAGASAFATGVGAGGSGAAFGGATAIGNALNVVTVGNNNTVVVTAEQTNNGNVTADTSVNGHH